MLGFHVSAREFLNNPKLQDSAMVAYLRFNAKRLSTYIEQYSGKTIHGVKISKAGILAGAHLKGAGGIIEFFVRKGWYDRKDRNYLRDANGTHIASYIVKCQDFELTLI